MDPVKGEGAEAVPAASSGGGAPDRLEPEVRHLGAVPGGGAGAACATVRGGLLDLMSPLDPGPPPRVIGALATHREAVLACRACPGVHASPVIGPPVASRVYLLGQAPGPREAALGRPFAWTAGRTLFRWLATLGVDERTVRERVYFAAVLRCFPGKARGGGDRVPSPDEIARCEPWIAAEVSVLRPELVIAVGRLAISRVAGSAPRRLEDVVGPARRGTFHGVEVDWVALPHPSGVSAWPKVEPGRALLGAALAAVGAHPAWRATFAGVGG